MTTIKAKNQHQVNLIINTGMFLILMITLSNFLGWQFDINIFKTFSTGHVLMNPMTSLGFILSFIVLAFNLFKWRHAKAITYCLSSLIILIGMLRLCSILQILDFRIDHLLFKQKLSGIKFQNAMALNTAICFLVTGTALMFLKISKAKALIPQFLSLFTALIALFSILGYVYSAESFYQFFHAAPMAFNTAICFFMLSISILLILGEYGFMKEIMSTRNGGFMARIAIPTVLILPTFLGYLRLIGEQKGLYPASLGVALFAIATIIILVVLIWICTVSINRSENLLKQEIQNRIAIEIELRKSNKFLDAILENIPDMVVVKESKDLRFVQFNKAAEKLIGVKREDMLGKNDYDLFTKNEADYFQEEDRKVLEEKKMKEFREEKLITVTGEKWLQTKKIPITDENGANTYILGISVDITEKRVQEKIVKDFYAELEKQIKERTRELYQTQEEIQRIEKAFLQEQINKQTDLLLASLEGQEKEKKQLGMELHDNINQILTSAKLYLDIAQKNPDQSEELVDKAKGTILLCIQEIRKLSKTLVVQVVNEVGLDESIQELIASMPQTANFKTVFNLKPELDLKLNDDQKLNIYRIIQEQLNNIIKHAKASLVTVEIRDYDGIVEMTITDDGRGFDTHAKKNGIGLTNMVNRSKVIHGELEIKSAKGKGTEIKLKFPLNHDINNYSIPASGMPA